MKFHDKFHGNRKKVSTLLSKSLHSIECFQVCRSFTDLTLKFLPGNQRLGYTECHVKRIPCLEYKTTTGSTSYLQIPDKVDLRSSLWTECFPSPEEFVIFSPGNVVNNEKNKMTKRRTPVFPERSRKYDESVIFLYLGRRNQTIPTVMIYGV